MKQQETRDQRFRRLLVRAVREAEVETANVLPGSVVAGIEDVTHLVSRMVPALEVDFCRRLHMLEPLTEGEPEYTNYVQAFTKASVACLMANRPSKMIYVRRTSQTAFALDAFAIKPSHFTYVFSRRTGRYVENSVLAKTNKYAIFFGENNVYGSADNCIRMVKEWVGHVERSVTEKLFECPVCMDKKTSVAQPFGCVHSVCSDCCLRMFQLDPQNTKMRCPICRRAVKKLEFVYDVK